MSGSLMLTRGRKLVIVLMLLICIGCYFAEVMDTWDNGVQGTSDTEFSLLRLVLVVAAAFLVVRTLVRMAALLLRRFDASQSEVSAGCGRAVGSFVGMVLRSESVPLRI